MIGGDELREPCTCVLARLDGPQQTQGLGVRVHTWCNGSQGARMLIAKGLLMDVVVPGSTLCT
eukprot:1143628-Pelagomonas_calceolata.AAC.2